MSNYLFFICRGLLLAALLPWALPAAAGPDWLIATGDETAQAGEPLLLVFTRMGGFLTFQLFSGYAPAT
ncbi:MAG TPA: hypothetical protein PK372_08640 [Rugosibacter sp.]|jgi:hypothetical protein|nr:hypothetical protein [Rugosibacter sp.]HPB90663.1 hypothetical protein [Rugosibacter sp.]HQN45517.1 hypothetical protein [Rugosibacter sp.]HQQ35976.1 hypothetical protein [Rugosibacter sp.]